MKAYPTFRHLLLATIPLMMLSAPSDAEAYDGACSYSVADGYYQILSDVNNNIPPAQCTTSRESSDLVYGEWRSPYNPLMTMTFDYDINTTMNGHTVEGAYLYLHQNSYLTISMMDVTMILTPVGDYPISKVTFNIFKANNFSTYPTDAFSEGNPDWNIVKQDHPQRTDMMQVTFSRKSASTTANRFYFPCIYGWRCYMESFEVTFGSGGTVAEDPDNAAQVEVQLNPKKSGNNCTISFLVPLNQDGSTNTDVYYTLFTYPGLTEADLADLPSPDPENAVEQLSSHSFDHISLTPTEKWDFPRSITVTGASVLKYMARCEGLADSEVKSLYISRREATGLDEIEILEEELIYYNLNGVRVTQPRKGEILIQSGKEKKTLLITD